MPLCKCMEYSNLVALTVMARVARVPVVVAVEMVVGSEKTSQFCTRQYSSCNL